MTTPEKLARSLALALQDECDRFSEHRNASLLPKWYPGAVEALAEYENDETGK